MKACSRALATILVMLALAVQSLGANAVPTARVAATGVASDSTSLLFIENVGQFAEAARFRAVAGDVTLWLAEDALWITVMGPESGSPKSEVRSPESEVLSPESALRSPRTASPAVGVNLKLSFVGANPHPTLAPARRSSTQVAFFHGNDPARWRSHVPAWGSVTYHDLYPGIDLELASDASGWRPRLHAQPGADLQAVRLRVEGAALLVIDGDALVLSTVAGECRVPLLEVNGTPISTLAQPEVQGQEIRMPFASPLRALDKRTVLAPRIVPVSPDAGTLDLVYSALLGGSGDERAPVTAVDDVGAAYVTGVTRALDFPTTPGAFDPIYNGGLGDAFVVKVSPDGSHLLYSTFLGGSHAEKGMGIAVDATGAAYVAGMTGSSDFPTTPGAYSTTFGNGDVFVTKLNVDGSALAYSTFLGGSGWECEGVFAYGYYPCTITIDESGDAYIAGTTMSPDFPVTPGVIQPTCHDCVYYYPEGFVTKLNAEGTALLYSTYLGGSEWEWISGIAVDMVGAAYVTGSTNSWDFPVTPGAFATSYRGGTMYGGDGFVARLSPDATALTYSTFLGGSQDDCYALSCRIAVDATGQATVAGDTLSADFPTTSGAFDPTFGGGIQDGFVTKLNSTGSAQMYSTFMGGGGNDGTPAVVLGPDGAAYVCGFSDSVDFPTTPDAYSQIPHGLDATLSKLTLDGSALEYSTFLGGLDDDACTSLVLDPASAVHLVGDTHSADFPTTPGAFNRTFYGDDLFVAKLVIGMQVRQYLPLAFSMAPP